MKLLQKAVSRLGALATPRALSLLAASVLAFIAPQAVFAAGSEASVRLDFSPSDMTYLYVSLGFGIIALIAAWVLAKGVLAASPGNEKMQEVGLAIKEGALAYLKKQVTTMSYFVAALAVGLFFIYTNQYGSTQLGIFMAISFIAGVAASYIAGYTGMLLAVNGNMRTANAALTSYKKTLEVAFRSGAVAGMVTVGMGLLGATTIFLLAREDAMKLLIGFGFGGSLAALFMRVGGGIFTKAADVGADLVGKVEAGIPEDDPRNPATIADNVGDNVGDCAGMAADIFESYEVTLVAAIVLGAATAAIFDQQTWMRLIMFALMARGVGIIASIIGIFSVKGSDDIDADPLMAIRKGFYASAAIALIATFGLAWFMMGGKGVTINSVKLTSFNQKRLDIINKIIDERNKIATEKKVPGYQVQAEDVSKSDAVKALKLDPMNEMQVVQTAMQFADQERPELPKLSGYQKANFEDKNNKFLDYSTVRPGVMGGQPDILSIREKYSKDGKPVEMGIYKFKVTMSAPAQPGQPATPPRTQEILAGPGLKADLQAGLATNSMGGKVDEGTLVQPGNLYVNKDGKFIVAAVGSIENIIGLQSTPDSYYAIDATSLKSIVQSGQTDPNAMRRVPPRQQFEQAEATETTVPWYMFAIAIGFGILMAFAIELLTDYYVSTHKRPVQEVAGVSNAGAAPMIIQGFAYALESSVFMVFALVIALLAPLYFFPPDLYGTYILSFYGIALVGLGLLTTTGFVLAMDTFGPISDNAQGVFEMSGAGHTSESGSKAVQRLDAAGNTTKALTKGFAIATAVIAAVALFHSYLEDAHLATLGLRLDIPEIFLGLLIGGAAPYLFSAFSINAVGRASFKLITEVRRQFREDPGIMAGTSKPNYARCVAIVTQAAQRELLGPGILAIALPIAVAFGFSIGKPHTMIGGQAYNLTGAQALGGFLAGAILSGQLMAVLLANAGGMWDNAKKLIEDGLYGGKGTEAHKAGVVCDTVGDPFKDTAGPALNPLIKVMNLVALLLAPFVIKPFDNTVLTIITVVALGALAYSIYYSKKGSLSEEMQKVAGEAEKSDYAHHDEPNNKRKILVEEELTHPAEHVKETEEMH